MSSQEFIDQKRKALEEIEQNAGAAIERAIARGESWRAPMFAMMARDLAMSVMLTTEGKCSVVVGGQGTSKGPA